jgi:Arc/MetJ family transcription regulator
MRESRESIMKINMEITDDSTQSAMRAIKKNSYPEDRALYNNLKTKNLLDINLTEKQALMRAVASGLNLRASLDGMIKAKTIELTDRATPQKRRLVLNELIWMLKELRGDIV